MILSPPRQTFGLTYATRLGMAFILLGGAFVVWLIASETKTTSPIPYAIEGGLVVLTVVFWIMIGKSALTVHDEGIRRVSAFGTKELEWHRVREYRYRVAPMQGGGLIGAIYLATKRARQGRQATTNFFLTVIGDDGTKISVNQFYKDQYEAVGLILGALHPRMRPKIDSEVASTGAMFGPLRLSARDLTWKKNDPVLLAELMNAEIAGQMLRIRKKGKMLSLVSVRSDKVPNVLLLLETMEKLGVGAGSAPTIDPLARVRI